MKKFKDFFCVIFAVLLIASASGCTGYSVASSGVNFKGKNIGMVPPT